MDKILYPSIQLSKAELIQTYMQLAPYVLPHLEGRPLTLIRFPDGVHGAKFYSKNKPKWTPKWIDDIEIAHDNDTIKYIIANETATLAWTANLAALDLHPMQVKSKHMNQPDQFIYDLDPSPEFGFDRVKELALSLRDFLSSFGYHPFIKTSGSKGLHIYIPLIVGETIEDVFAAFKKISQEYVAANKDIVTLGITKKKRKGKVLLDIYRNHKSQTCAAPYTTRAREGAPISTPFRWELMDEVASSKQWNAKNIMPYIAEHGDPWAQFRAHSVELHTVARRKKPVKSSVSQEEDTADTLVKYKEKRDFTKTEEPAPQLETGNNDRFVIQLHDASNLHYDLRLEQDGVLLSWAIPKGFPTGKGFKRLAIETEPHPVKYLNFEGTIPKDEYGGGTMWIFDQGRYDLIKKDKKKIQVRLHGKMVEGIFTLINTKDKQWLLSTPDDREDSRQDNQPMLAGVSEKVPAPKNYFFEVKWDGIRVVITIWFDKVTILSRSGRDITDRFPAIVAQLKDEMSHSAVLDGEIVVLDSKGAPDFSKVISRMHTSGKSAIERASKTTKAALYAFDCLEIDGIGIAHLPIEKRRDWLRVLFDDREHVRYSNSFEDGKALFEAAQTHGLEGIMAKRKGASYALGKRSDHWIKVKVRHDDEAVLMGYTEGKGDRSGSFGSLHLAKSVDGNYVYMGKVGTGFDTSKRNEIFAKLQELEVIKKPIKDKIEEESRTVWVEVAYIIKIKYASLSSNNTYREPVFKAMFSI